MDAWAGLYSVTASAAATLMGLLFVAVSLNSAAVLSAGHEHSKSLAEQSFRNYIAVLVVSLVALFPRGDIRNLSTIALAVAVISAAMIVNHLAKLFRSRLDRKAHWNALRRHTISLLGFVVMAYAAVKPQGAVGDSGSLFAAATVLLLISATLVSWELLLAMALAQRANGGGAP